MNEQPASPTFGLGVVLRLLDELILVELRVSRLEIEVRLELESGGLRVGHDNLTSVAIPRSAITCRETGKSKQSVFFKNKVFNPIKK